MSIKENDKKQIEQPYIYQGNMFNIDKPEDWKDGTIYTLLGPIDDDIQHNILITFEDDVPFDSVEEYADWQIEALEETLQGCLLLNRESISLTNGLPAYRAIFRWYPTDELRLYQEQVFVLVGNTGYKLTTSFTKETRKTLGPQIERILMSFQPKEHQSNNNSDKGNK